MRKYFIQTFGCQFNTSDSERIEADYQARGYTPVTSWQEADEIILNTCAVRQSAEERAKGLLNNIRLYLEATGKPKPKIILTGCMVHHGDEKLLKMLPLLDEIMPINEVGFNYGAVRRDQHHAWVPISVGCNSFCTYCIVPFSRGREVSRSFTDIMAEVKSLVDQGYSEITLLGMNVNSWGLEKVGISLRKMLLSLDHQFDALQLPDNQSQYHQADGTPPFVSLLKAISQFDQIKKIRFLTSNPWDFHDELIEEIRTNLKIDRYLHLPLQSGSDRILKLMNRGYTTADYQRVINKLKAAVPDITIGTDIIVGFPTETEADFNQTVEFAKLMDWHIAFVARYSPRPGTAAYRSFKDDVLPAEKKRRWLILDKLINRKHLHDRPKIVKSQAARI